MMFPTIGVEVLSADLGKVDPDVPDEGAWLISLALRSTALHGQPPTCCNLHHPSSVPSTVKVAM